MKKPWEKYLLALAVFLVALLMAQFHYSKPQDMAEGAFIVTKPSGALISMPQAGSVQGYQLKPIARSPGPLPLNLAERSRFTFVIDLPGFQRETINLSPEELRGEPTTLKLSPKVSFLIPMLYLVRDWAFLLIGLLTALAFVGFVVLPQQRQRRAQQALWTDGKMKRGMHFHGYHLLRELGEGGAGLVFLAERPESVDRQLYALKALHTEGKSEGGLREELERECKACALLDHPCIVRLYDWGEVQGFVYLVFEFIEGQTLDRVKQPDSLSVCDWASQLVLGLRYAHAQGIVHRDLKPANIVIDKAGFAKILDFGISATMEGEQQGGAGTIGYMAPEQANGVVSPACDYYSLGVTLYRLLTGATPFDGEDYFQVLAAQSRGEFLSLRERSPDLPESFSELIDELLKVDPNERLQDPEEVLSRLSRIRESLSSSAD